MPKKRFLGGLQHDFTELGPIYHAPIMATLKTEKIR